MNNKQNKPKDHHYVPVCFLKNFLGENEKLVTLNLQNVAKGYPTKIKLFTPSQICYVENYYTITEELKGKYEDLSVLDALFVESVLFHKLENAYQDLLQKLTKTRLLDVLDATMFADFIVNLKLRNPFWREKIIEKNKASWLQESLFDITQSLTQNPQFSHIPDAIKTFFVEKLGEDNLAEKEFGKRYQLFSLIARASDTSDRNKKIRDAIMRNEWVLLIASGIENFIVTDNPGFSLSNGKTYNTRFIGDYQFYFPLSPRYCLMFGDKTDKRFLKKRNKKIIATMQFSDHAVDAINQFQLEQFHKYAIGCDDAFIKKIRKIR